MDKVNCSREGPLPLEGGGHPSEQTLHQDLFRVKMRTPRKEVFLFITSLLVNVFVFYFVLFRAVCPFCSIRVTIQQRRTNSDYDNPGKIMKDSFI